MRRASTSESGEQARTHHDSGGALVGTQKEYTYHHLNPKYPQPEKNVR